MCPGLQVQGQLGAVPAAAAVVAAVLLLAAASDGPEDAARPVPQPQPLKTSSTVTPSHE